MLKNRTQTNLLTTEHWMNLFLSFCPDPLLLLPSVQWIFCRGPSDLAKGQAEGLCWGRIPISSSSSSCMSDPPVLQPERLKVLSSYIHLCWASCWQVPLGQQIPVLEWAAPSTWNRSRVTAWDGSRDAGTKHHKTLFAGEKRLQDSLSLMVKSVNNL